MTRVSLIAYLKTGQLGPFERLCSRDVVLATLGPPPYWDGDGGISYQASRIWVYNSVQFNFDEHMRLEGTLVQFDLKFDGTEVRYSEWSNPYISLNGLSIENICTPERFVATTSANDIATTQAKRTRGQILINTTAGVQGRFGCKAKQGSYREDGGPIFTDSPYLHMITTVLLDSV